MRLVTTNYAFESATTVTASAEDSNFPASNLKSYHRSKQWRNYDNTGSVVFDIQTAEEVDSVVILWPKEDGFTMAPATTITLQASATNVWTSPPVSVVMTYDEINEMASHYFTTAQEYRYWRVVLNDSSDTTPYVNLGVVILGKSIEIQTADNGFSFVISDKSQIIRNDFGNEYIDLYPKMRQMQINLTGLDISDLELLMQYYQEVGQASPVFITLDETGTTFGKNTFAIYGKWQSDFKAEHVNYTIFNTSLSIRELA